MKHLRKVDIFEKALELCWFNDLCTTLPWPEWKHDILLEAATKLEQERQLNEANPMD